MQAFFTFFQHLFCKKAHTAAPAFSPSIADDMIPPEYPAPSPHGKSRAISELSIVSGNRRIRTGEEVLVSTPIITASLLINPCIFFSNCVKPSRSRSTIGTGSHLSSRDGIKPGAYDESGSTRDS